MTRKPSPARGVVWAIPASLVLWALIALVAVGVGL